MVTYEVDIGSVVDNPSSGLRNVFSTLLDVFSCPRNHLSAWGYHGVALVFSMKE